jgi:hypothetical protein
MNLVLAAAIGVVMRYAFIGDLEFEYTHWLHAHSHLAMLGWIYLALVCMSTLLFFPHQSGNRYFRFLFYASLGASWGACIAFVFQGYGAFSIAFLGLHVLLSYAFVSIGWKQLAGIADKSLSSRLLRTAFIFLIVSTLALWALPVLIASDLKGTDYYYMTIQFFLHFQLNGWFVFSVLAMFFKCVEQSKVMILQREGVWFYYLLTTSCILTYALAVAWSNPLEVVFIINGTGVCIQFVALMVFCVLLYRIRFQLVNVFGKPERLFIYVGIGCFILKVLIQTAVVIPSIAEVGYTIRGFVIGFLHLILLGVITMFLFGLGLRFGLLNNRGRPGGLLVLIGFLIVELLLFVQGILLWAEAGFMKYYHEALVGASVAILIGVAWMLVAKEKFPVRTVRNPMRQAGGGTRTD